MTYILRLNNIPVRPEHNTGMYIVKKLLRSSGEHRGEIIAARLIWRLCPLAPVIVGEADRAVTPTSTIGHYNAFYLNKYHNVDEHRMLHVIQNT
jgi:hypothetical protein